MKVIGIIAEYNPFHNGHLYQINTVKEMYPDSLIIAIINGYFMQRGELSVLSKEDKVKIALDNNIDIVLELPFVYGTQSSDIFGYQAVKILNELNIDILCFGSETNDIELLKNIADIQLNDEEYENRVKEYLDKGTNYPTAMAKALNMDIDINKPNDLLGISYIKAIKQINNNIVPISILRTSAYHDVISSDSIVSAKNIREKYYNGENIDKYVPKGVIDKLINVEKTNIFDLLKFKILTDKDLSIYLDVDEGLSVRIKNVINKSNTTNELIKNIKTKRYTYNKISRMLNHILCSFTVYEKDNINDLEYIRILGFSTKGKEYLNQIKKELKTPILNKYDTKKYKTLEIEKRVTNVYSLIFDDIDEQEIKNKPIITK